MERPSTTQEEKKAAGVVAPVAHVDAIAQRSSLFRTHKKKFESLFSLNVPLMLNYDVSRLLHSSPTYKKIARP